MLLKKQTEQKNKVMIEYWKNCLKKYADFSGRSRRSEYWYFTLVNFIIIFLIALISGFTTLTSPLLSTILEILMFLYVIGIIIPAIAVTIRRLHDIGKSGWWYCVTFVPFIGGIWLLILTCTDSQAGDNEYGPNPKTSEIDLINTIK